MDTVLEIIYLLGLGVASNFVYDWIRKLFKD